MERWWILPLTLIAMNQLTFDSSVCVPFLTPLCTPRVCVPWTSRRIQHCKKFLSFVCAANNHYAPNVKCNESKVCRFTILEAAKCARITDMVCHHKSDCSSRCRAIFHIKCRSSSIDCTGCQCHKALMCNRVAQRRETHAEVTI